MFRFTIRDVLLLTLLVAVIMAWLMDRNGIRGERARMAQREAVLISQKNLVVDQVIRADIRVAEMREFHHRVLTAALFHGLEIRGLNDLIDQAEQARSNSCPWPNGPTAP